MKEKYSIGSGDLLKRTLVISFFIFAAIIITTLLVRYPQVFRGEAGRRKNQISPMVDVNRDGIVDISDLETYQDIYKIIRNGGWSFAFYVVDINNDGVVNIQDASGIGYAFGQSVTNCNWADIDGDLKVKKSDLRKFSKFGQINQYTNRYDINNDSYVDEKDVAIAQKELGKRCRRMKK